MLEWLKRHVWKACDRPKRFEGSNPSLSASRYMFFSQKFLSLEDLIYNFK